MKMKNAWHAVGALALCVGVAVSAPLKAVEMIDIELTCPLGAEVFTTQTVQSQTREGQMLDFKPFGDLVAPHPLAVCPSNGLVMYQEHFSPEDLQRLAVLIDSPAYQALRAEHTTYHLLARTFEHMQRDALQIAFMHLQSTWEVDTQPARYAEYSENAIAAFDQYLKGSNPMLRDFVTGHLIIAELYRRNGNFAAASSMLERIKFHEESSKPYASRVIILLYQLINAEDATPHAMP